MSVSIEVPIKLDLPTPYKSNMKETFDYFAEKGDNVLKFVGYDAILSLFYLYLLKKYKSNCVLYDTTKKNSIVDIAIGLAFHNTYGVNEETKRELMEMNRINCNRMAKQINSCLKNRSKNKVIVLPVTLIDYSPEGERDDSTHNNLLLIRFGSNEIEHYEPHGSMTQVLPTMEARLEAYENMVQSLTDNLITPLNALKGDDGTPDFKLIPTMETCPETESLQMLETYSKLPKKESEIGYCAIWALFVAELALRNHNLTLREIIRLVHYDILQFDKRYGRPTKKINFNGQKVAPNDYLRKIARGYVHFVNEKLMKYFTDIFGKSIDIEGIVDIAETNIELFDTINYRVDGAIFIENVESVQGKKTDEQLLASLKKEMRKIETTIENPLENSRLYKRYYYADEYVKNREGLGRITPVSIFTPTPTSKSKSSLPHITTQIETRKVSTPTPSSKSSSSSSSSSKSSSPIRHTRTRRTRRRSPANYGLSTLFKETTRKSRPRTTKKTTRKSRGTRKSPANYGLSKLFIEK
jgi:hypothetical protein